MQRRIRETKPQRRRQSHDDVERTLVSDAASLQRSNRARRSADPTPRGSRSDRPSPEGLIADAPSPDREDPSACFLQPILERGDRPPRH